MDILVYGVPDDSFLFLVQSKLGEESIKCFVPEGRPLLEGLHTVANRLITIDCEVTIITDNMIACLMEQKSINCAFIFYYEKHDSHIICQIGSAIVAICANNFSIPVYYYPADNKPISEFGENGDLIFFDGVQVAPEGILTYVPLLENVPLAELHHNRAEAF